jgi:Suppressor of fused protein (SUFU)
MRLRLPGRRRPSVHDGVLDHYRRFWGEDRVDEVHWTPGPIASRLPDLHIAKVRPKQPGGMWIFATIGAWRATEDERHGLEFVAVARSESASVLVHLGMVAYYHAGPPENRLGVGHTVSIGEGWVDGSPLDSLLVSLPYLWGPKLEHCLLSGRHIQILWVIPISEAEREYKRVHGADALEQRFEDLSFDYLDPFRRSVSEGTRDRA